MASTLPASKSGLYADPREDWLALRKEEILDPGAPDRRSPSSSLGSRRPALSDRGNGRRHRLRPQHRRDRLCRGPLDVSRQRAGSDAPGRRGRIRRRRRGDERERRLRSGRDLRRHRRPRQSAAGRRRARRCWRRKSPPATAASAASGIPRHGMRIPTSPACMPCARRACCSIRPFARALPASRRWSLSFDAWLFHPQIGELADLARAFPDTRIVLDHCGGPVGVGSYANRREEIFKSWKASIQDIAKCPNVVVKLGGLAMRLLGYDFHERPMPPSSEEAGRGVASLYRDLHRGLRPRPLHVREQFSAGQGPVQLSGDLQRLQAHRRAI